MTEEEKKVLWKYLEDIQGNLNDLIQDKADDAEEVLTKYKDLMLAITKLATEFSMLTDELKQVTKIIKKEHTGTNNLITDKVQEMEKIVKGKTKIILKEVDNAKKKWFQFWIKDEKIENGIAVKPNES